MFIEACADQRSNMFKFPEDFILFELCEFDSEKGSFSTLTAPIELERAAGHVAHAKEMLRLEAVREDREDLASQFPRKESN